MSVISCTAEKTATNDQHNLAKERTWNQNEHETNQNRLWSFRILCYGMVILWLPLGIDCSNLMIVNVLLFGSHQLNAFVNVLQLFSIHSKRKRLFFLNVKWKHLFFCSLFVCLTISKINFISTICLCSKPRFAHRTHGINVFL